MRIKNLRIKNIGPFDNAYLEFITEDFEIENPPVIFITGENGTGKSIIIDSIRALLGGHYSSPIERDIFSQESFLIDSKIYINNIDYQMRTVKKNTLFNHNGLDTNHSEISNLFRTNIESRIKKNFIFDYWTSKLTNDSFNIQNIATIDPSKYLENALTGIHKNLEVIKTILFFDYLKDSRDLSEKLMGEDIYNILERIINLSIVNGKLSHVSRVNLKPIIKIGSREVTLDKLSSGNLYLIQRLVNLLSQVYSICRLNNILISEYKSIKGILIIDEAENHLHPKWQKVLLQIILEIFPKLQIIVTTHSPFIVSSISNCKVFVCSSNLDSSEVKEETDFYSNKPIEEILQSPLFHTRNFNLEISELLDKRKKALQQNNNEEINSIEKKLLTINPEYFDYFKLDEIIKSIKK